MFFLHKPICFERNDCYEKRSIAFEACVMNGCFVFGTVMFKIKQ